MTQAPLAGLKVLDLSSGPAGGLATMILADFGANVCRVIDAEYDFLNDVPSARMWLRGKSVSTSVSVAGVDVVVISLPNSHDNSDYDHLEALNPSLIYCEVSAAGADQRLPMYEAVVVARAGRMKQLENILPDHSPCYAGVQVATHTTAMNIVSGVLAALHKRRVTGVGEKLTTSLLQGLIPYDMGGSMMLQKRAEGPDRPPPDWGRPFMPTLNYQPVQCADGKWLQLGNLLPHLFVNYMRRIGLEDELSKLPEATEEVRDKIIATMQTKTRDEWMSIFIRDGGIAAHGYLHPRETLVDPDMTMNGHVISLSGTRQLGPLANLTATPAQITEEHKDGDGWQVPPRSPSRRAPLDGITVIEISTIIATPLGASFLGDMGARVIKVEAIGGDPYRDMPGDGAVRCNQGKESICIDLKSEKGRAIVRKLVSKADILMHNYRPGVPERLGISYEQLREINPALIYLSANGYGQAGPGARRPSTHPVPGAALGGAGYQAGGTPEQLLAIPELREVSRRLMKANEVNPDPNTSVVICASALLGLTAREQTGMGQQIFVDMFGANAYANFDSMIDFENKPEREDLGKELKGPHPLYRLYPTADGWIFLGIKRPVEWQALCKLSDKDWLNEFNDPLAQNDPALANALNLFFANRSASDWEAFFKDTEVACVAADKMNSYEFFFDQCNEESQWMAQVPHPTIANYYRHKSMVSFSGSDLPNGAPEEAGGHADALMHELGYSDDEVKRYFADGILWRA